MTESRIYFDNAATTPLHADVLEHMVSRYRSVPYNPSSLHTEGRAARAALDGARDALARLLDVPRKSITFTGSGSESDALGVIGAVKARAPRGHIVTSAIEHHAVMHACEALRDEGYEISTVPVHSDGVVDLDAFAHALRPDTLLVSVMYANNEIGTIAPLTELVALTRARSTALFHTDAVQAAGWLPLSPGDLGVDLLTISAHKFHGPKGVGALYVRPGVELVPVIPGGGQEFGRRSGTEDIAAICGMVAAFERVERTRDVRTTRVRALRDAFERGILARVDEVRINGANATRLPTISNISFAGIDAEALLARFDLEGLAVSSGSACTSGVLEPSHVLRALDIDSRWLRGVIRFSLGEMTSQDEISRVLELVPRIVAELREERSR